MSQSAIDWNALAQRAIDTAITVIGNKLQGTKAPIVDTGTAVATPIGSVSSVGLYLFAGIVAVLGAVLIFKHR